MLIYTKRCCYTNEDFGVPNNHGSTSKIENNQLLPSQARASGRYLQAFRTASRCYCLPKELLLVIHSSSMYQGLVPVGSYFGGAEFQAGIAGQSH